MSTVPFEYKYVYMPSHPKANPSGCVYEHILVAEQKLGRQLTSNECVHHIDGNKKNNSPDNLMVFASISDHTCFHAGGSIYEINSVWHANKKRVKKVCPFCKKVFQQKESTQIYCSVSCSNHSNTKIKTPARDIQDLLFANNGNFSAVGRILNITSNGVAKILKRNGLPHHSSDYKCKT